MDLVLYGAPLSPFVRKVDVTLREKGIEFESENVNIPVSDSFREFSPLGRMPALRRSVRSPFDSLLSMPGPVGPWLRQHGGLQGTMNPPQNCAPSQGTSRYHVSSFCPILDPHLWDKIQNGSFV